MWSNKEGYNETRLVLSNTHAPAILLCRWRHIRSDKFHPSVCRTAFIGQIGVDGFLLAEAFGLHSLFGDLALSNQVLHHCPGTLGTEPFVVLVAAAAVGMPLEAQRDLGIVFEHLRHRGQD